MGKNEKKNTLLSEEEIVSHGENFDEKDEDTLDEKISQFGVSAGTTGAKCIYYVLLLYYTLKSDGALPKKGLILGALGYFLFPFDVVSDLIPLFGYIDDISVMLGVLVTVSSLITDEIRNKAKKRLDELGLEGDTDEFDADIK